MERCVPPCERIKVTGQTNALVTHQKGLNKKTAAANMAWDTTGRHPADTRRSPGRSVARMAKLFSSVCLYYLMFAIMLIVGL